MCKMSYFKDGSSFIPLETDRPEAVVAVPSAGRSLTGFTLIELLVVIAIIAVIATATILVINPAELIKQGRDSTRLSDLNNINRSLGFLQVDQPDTSFGSSSVVYVSIPDTSSTCANLGLPSLPGSWAYACATDADHRKVDGNGWIPADFTSFSAGSPLSVLPIDPINAVSSGLYYTYITGGSWEMTASMESKKRNPSGGVEATTVNDGGQVSYLYEIGSDLSLNPLAPVGEWQFEGNAMDSSGNGNHGSGGSFNSSGKVGQAANFPGTITVPHSSSLTPTKMTVMMWVKVDSWGVGYQDIFLKDLNQIGLTNGSGGMISTITCVTSGSFNGTCGAYPAAVRYISIPDTDWHHYTLRYDQSTVRTYRDGSYYSSYSVPGGDIVWSTGDLRMALASIHTGLLDDVRIFDRPLADFEISAIYDATK